MGCSETAGDGGGGVDTSVNPSTGCDSGSLDPSVTRVDISFDGNSRSYELHVPASYDGSTPTPLTLNFHGVTSDGPAQRSFSDMDPVADARGFVVAYPNGIEKSWNAGLCCGTAASEEIDDVGFARAVIDDLAERGCIDLNRVYATGMSNGAHLSHRLACEATDVIAAIAPVAGVPLITDCNPSRPIPVIHFHGTEDPLVPYDGSRPGYPSVPDTHDAWAARNGCTSEPSVTFENNTVTCETFDKCDGNVRVTLCTAEGAGHCWPGQSVCPFGASTLDISASEAMTDFFEDFSLNQ
jgi:polyhydroxybutyrate depolymerase